MRLFCTTDYTANFFLLARNFASCQCGLFLSVCQKGQGRLDTIDLSPGRHLLFL